MVTEGVLDLKRVIDMLKKKGYEYPDWTKVKLEDIEEEVVIKDDFTCEPNFQKVLLFETSAQEFLSFALQDLEEDSERGRVNALSNAKRAIECRIDEILALWNFKGFTSRKEWSNLPGKLNLLKGIGVVAPDVLRNVVTSKRNLLEHEYWKPKDYGEIKNIVDIVELFLRATDAEVERGYIGSATIIGTRWFEEQRTERFRYDLGYSDRCELMFSLEEGTLRVKYSRGTDIYRRHNLKTGAMSSYDSSQPDWSIEEEQNGLIQHCAMEDVKELMILLRRRPNESI